MEEAAAGHDSAMVAVMGFPGSSFWKRSGNPSPWVQWSLPTITVPASWFWGETRRRCSRLPPWQRPGEPAGACPCGSPAPFTRPLMAPAGTRAGGTVPEDLGLPGTENSRAL